MKIISTEGEDISVEALPKAVSKMLAQCKLIPKDEGWTTRKLAKVLNYTVQSLTNSATSHPALEPYRLRVAISYYWGNKKTIAKEKKKRVDACEL